MSSFLKRVVPEFFGGRFDGVGDELRFFGGLLTAESLMKFKAGIDRLAMEFEDLAHKDARRPLEEIGDAARQRGGGAAEAPPIDTTCRRSTGSATVRPAISWVDGGWFSVWSE